MKVHGIQKFKQHVKSMNGNSVFRKIWNTERDFIQDIFFQFRYNGSVLSSGAGVLFCGGSHWLAVGAGKPLGGF